MVVVEVVVLVVVVIVVVVVVFVVVYVVFSSDQGWKARPAPGSPACGGGEEILMCWEIRLIYQLQLHFLYRQESLTHKVDH